MSFSGTSLPSGGIRRQGEEQCESGEGKGAKHCFILMGGGPALRDLAMTSLFYGFGPQSEMSHWYRFTIQFSIRLLAFWNSFEGPASKLRVRLKDSRPCRSCAVHAESTRIA